MEGKDIIRGACFVDGATGSTTFPLGYRVGYIASVVRVGVGVYVITFEDGGLNQREHQASLQIEG